MEVVLISTNAELNKYIFYCSFYLLEANCTFYSISYQSVSQSRETSLEISLNWKYNYSMHIKEAAPKPSSQLAHKNSIIRVAA